MWFRIWFMTSALLLSSSAFFTNNYLVLGLESLGMLVAAYCMVAASSSVVRFVDVLPAVMFFIILKLFVSSSV